LTSLSTGVLAALALATFTPAATAEAGYGFFGIIPQAPLAAKDVPILRSANPGSMRIGISWAGIQGQPGPCGPGAYDPGSDPAVNNNCDWSQIDHVATIAANAGIRILPYVFAPPTWTKSYAMKGSADKPAVPPIYAASDRAAWKRFVTAAVNRYGPGGVFWESFAGRDLPAKVLQIWNEPSSPTYFSPRPDTEKFAQVLKLASAAIRKASDGVKVGLPGVFYSPRKDGGGILMPNYYRQLYAVPGIKRHFDYAAVHPYARKISEVEFQVVALRKIMDRAGDKRTKIIVSELGWGSDGPKGHTITSTIKGQARLMRGAFNLLLNHRRSWGIFGVNWYSWRDVPPDQAICPACPWTGLLETGYGRKPAFRTFRNFTH
jgi:hypothetical protein